MVISNTIKFPKLISYKILVIAITPIFIFQILDSFLNDGTFWGLIGIALTILGLGIPYIWVYKKRTNEFDETLKFLERFVQSQIDEKIAVLQMYPLEVNNWKSHGMQFVNQMTNRITSDITAISRLKNDISNEQRIAINEALIKLVNEMKNNNLETSKIEGVLRILNP
jgi:hypothetical protein